MSFNPDYPGLGAAGISTWTTSMNKIKTAEDYLEEAAAALKLAAGLLVANGESTRAIWTLKALQKANDARG